MILQQVLAVVKWPVPILYHVKNNYKEPSTDLETNTKSYKNLDKIKKPTKQKSH